MNESTQRICRYSTKDVRFIKRHRHRRRCRDSVNPQGMLKRAWMRSPGCSSSLLSHSVPSVRDANVGRARLPEKKSSERAGRVRGGEGDGGAVTDRAGTGATESASGFEDRQRRRSCVCHLGSRIVPADGNGALRGRQPVLRLWLVSAAGRGICPSWDRYRTPTEVECMRLVSSFPRRTDWAPL